MAELIESTAAQAIPYPSDARQRALDAVIRYLEMLRAWTLTRRGVAGNGAGIVNVSDRTNFIYARFGASDGETVEARNVTLLDIADNDPILLARERPGALGSWLVVDWYGTGTPPFLLCDDCTGTLAYGYHFVYDTHSYAGNPYDLIFCAARNGVVYAIASVSSFGDVGDPHGWIYGISVTGSPAILADDGGANPHNDIYGFWMRPYTNHIWISMYRDDVLYPLSTVEEFTATPTAISDVDNHVDTSKIIPRWIEGFSIGTSFYLLTDAVWVVSNQYGFIVNQNLPNSYSISLGTGGTIDAWNLGGLYIYAVDSNGDFYSIDVSDPTTPTTAATIASAVSHAADVRANADAGIVWIADDVANEIVCVDVSTPASPVILSTTSVSYKPVALALCGSYLYVAMQDASDGYAQAFDVSDPSAPSSMATETTLPDFEPRPRQAVITAGRLCMVGVEISTQYPTLVTLTA